MTNRHSESHRHHSRLPFGMRLRVVAVIAAVAAMTAGCSSGAGRHQGTSQAVTPPRPAPRSGPPPLLAVHFDKGKYPLLGSRQADLAKAAEAFNTVLVSYGDDQLVQQARDRGLKVYLGFDEHQEFAAGKDITADVQGLVRFASAHRDQIAGIRVADRVNQGLTPEQTLGYLRATGGVLHQQLPGVPVVVDLSDWQLTCDLPGQDPCGKLRQPDYRYQTNANLLRIYHSGDVDGFMLADGLARDDVDCGGCTAQASDATAQTTAWRKARALFPRPFLLFARVAPLSFPQAHYPADATQAALAVSIYETIPLQQGADGVDLWAWSRHFDGTVRTFLDKNGASNPLWQQMVALATTMHAQGRPS